MTATLSTFWRYWKRFGHHFGRLQTQLVLALSYLLVFGPGKLILVLRGADPLQKAFPDPSPSLYHPKEPSPEDMGSYTRQF